VNLGTGGVVVVLMILGFLIPKPTHTRVLEDSAHKDEEIEKLQEALALERQRSNDATQAATVTNQLIGALTSLATEHRVAEKHEHKDAADKADARALAAGLDLTGKDLGL
jgi:hypothetical protein